MLLKLYLSFFQLETLEFGEPPSGLTRDQYN